ncbi:hypothetical protein ACLKA7_015688 [Drosophila subpalustris]
MSYLDDEFDYFIPNMTCLSLLNLPYNSRCMMVRKVPDCEALINNINYFEVLCCTLNILSPETEICVMMLFIFFVIVYVIITGIIVSTYLSPVMKILSVKMHMNEYFAGITLLAFANSFPDLISNMMPIRAQGALFTRTISNALVIILLCGGMVCYLKPFKMDGHCTVRDLLFLLLAVEVMSFIVSHESKVTETESLILLSFYGIYIIIQLSDLILMRRTIKKFRAEIFALRQQPISVKRNEMLRKKMAVLIDLENNEVMSIRKQNTGFYTQKSRASSAGSFFVTPVMKTNTNDVDYVSTRTILHNEKNPKNQFLISEFFSALNPIDAMDWRLSNSCDRVIIICKSPLVLVAKLLVPEVNYERYKHGWSKLLNCMQIITTPFVVITVVYSDLAKVYTSWHIELNVKYSLWSLVLTVPLAMFVFFHSRTDIPPYYHFLFIIITSLSSFVIIFMCAAEIEVLTTIVGIVFNLSDNFMDITFGSLINAILDLIAIYGMTMQGYEKMAFAAIFAGPFFSIIVGMAVPLYFNDHAREVGATVWLYGEHGEVCYIFFLITVISTLTWTLTLNFYSRRSIGIYCWILLFTFLLFAFCIEWNIIHGFQVDPYFPPQ